MPIIPQVRRALRKAVYGDTMIPQEFTIGLNQPQGEIAVSLHGMGESIDVTNRHTIACCSPLVIGIAVEAGHSAFGENGREFSLQFTERWAQDRILGVVRLATSAVLSLGSSELILFKVLGSTNYCLPRLRLWAHYVPEAHSNWRKLRSFDVKMSSLEIRASQVAFIRPHPLVLGSIAGEAGGNIFTMNLMGELGSDHFGFALKDSRRAAHLVERVGQIALSNVPLSLCPTAFKLAVNHTRESVAWNETPFTLKMSKQFCIPVPAAAPRVREMKIEQVRRIGSHTLFIARIISDETLCDAPVVHIIHGFYQHWRMRGKNGELEVSLIEDLRNKRGVATA
jgi:flavin reductase (DIM6/NTAB) family NADH-FMN oxidoreductase RutF